MKSTAPTKSIKETRKGPNGITVEIDSDQVFPNDPGMGTPVLVLYKTGTATLACAIGEYEVEGHRLTPFQMEWLYKIEAETDALLKPFWNKK